MPEIEKKNQLTTDYSEFFPITTNSVDTFQLYVFDWSEFTCRMYFKEQNGKLEQGMYLILNR